MTEGNLLIPVAKKDNGFHAHSFSLGHTPSLFPVANVIIKMEDVGIGGMTKPAVCASSTAQCAK